MTPPSAFEIAAARTPDDLAAVSALFRSYAASLDVDLAYQGFEAELRSLPGSYAAPGGVLLLAREAGGAPSGCAALRPLAPPRCGEMKRLFVAPTARGHGLGRQLAAAIIGEAERLGYTELKLDTLPSMHGAIALYRSLGFERTEPYYDSPIAGTVFLRRPLSRR